MSGKFVAQSIKQQIKYKKVSILVKNVFIIEKNGKLLVIMWFFVILAQLLYCLKANDLIA